MKPPLTLPERITLLRRTRRPRPLLEPAEVYAPYHRLLPAAVAAGGQVIVLRRLDDVDPALRVQWGDVELEICQVQHERRRGLDLTVLHCRDDGRRLAAAAAVPSFGLAPAAEGRC